MNASNKVGSGGVDAMILLVDVGSLTAFDPKGDLNGISQRWKRWKRSFPSYLTGKGVTDDKQKRALLLHAARVDVQIYFTMVSEEEIFSFTTTMKALDDYFVPKSTVPFERHFFKQIAQASYETVDQFVCRLQQLHDQVTDKCYLSHLGLKFLGQETVTLDCLLGAGSR